MGRERDGQVNMVYSLLLLMILFELPKKRFEKKLKKKAFEERL